MIPCSAVPNDAYVVDASYMGAPTVSIEKLDSSQAEAAAHAVLKVLLLLVISCPFGECKAGTQKLEWLRQIYCLDMACLSR